MLFATDERPGIERRGRPGAFRYFDAHSRLIRDPRTLSRVKALVIPPAWTDVWINQQAGGHIQATGRDSRGRKQFLYHENWRTTRDAAKYDQMIEFARTLPHVRRAVRASLRRSQFDRERVCAIVVRLLETSLIRIGNDEYARENNSFGLTTLRLRHAKVRGSRIQFSFRGKSAQHHEIEVKSPNLARLVRKLQDLPGQELFCYRTEGRGCKRLRSDDVNAYLRRHSGGNFTAKDFRTWAGTVLAALTLAQYQPPTSKTEAKRVQSEAVKAVAKRLGNTPAIARRSYIHPAIFEAFAAGQLPPLLPPDGWPPATSRTGLSPEERAVLRLLRQRSSKRARRPRILRSMTETSRRSRDQATERRSA